MTLDFGILFGNGIRRVTMTPNLLLAYADMVRIKIGRILLWGALSIVAIFGLTNNLFHFIELGQNGGWFLFFSTATVVTIGFFVYYILWGGPAAVKLYACIATEGFDEYIRKKIDELEKLVQPISIRLLLLKNRDVKRIRRLIITAQTLLELYELIFNEENVDTDLYDDINFVIDFTGLPGFCVKTVSKFK